MDVQTPSIYKSIMTHVVCHTARDAQLSTTRLIRLPTSHALAAAERNVRDVGGGGFCARGARVGGGGARGTHGDVSRPSARSFSLLRAMFARRSRSYVLSSAASSVAVRACFCGGCGGCELPSTSLSGLRRLAGALAAARAAG